MIQRLARRSGDRGGELRGLGRRKLLAQQREHAAAFGELRVGVSHRPRRRSAARIRRAADSRPRRCARRFRRAAPRSRSRNSFVSSRASTASRVGAEYRDRIVDRFHDAMTRFVEDQRARLGRKRRHALAARRGFRRQESFEHEAVARQSRDGQRRDRRARPRNRRDDLPPASRTARTSRNPGSLISGVPASAIKRDIVCRRESLRRCAPPARARCARAAPACARCCRRARAAARCGACPPPRRRRPSRSTAAARGERSSRLPIGVAMTQRRPGGHAVLHFVE